MPEAGASARRAVNSAMPAFRVLVVDDDRLMTEFLPRKLRKAMREGIQFLTAATAEEARSLIETHRPDVILSDYNLRESETGLDVLRHAATHAPEAARILFSGHRRAEIAGIDQADIHAYIEKPMKLDEMVPPLLRIIHERTGRDVSAQGGSGLGS